MQGQSQLAFGGERDTGVPATCPSMHLSLMLYLPQSREAADMLTLCSLQIISQGQAKAENITSGVGAQIKQLMLPELSVLLRR